MDMLPQSVHTAVPQLGTNHTTHATNVIAHVINGTTPDAPDVDKLNVMSDEMRLIFEVANFVILTGLISFFGMISNTLNILRQGLADSISISLLGLAISDFAASTIHLWLGTCINPLFAESGIPFNSPKVQYITAGWPHVATGRITSYITTYISFERCLCIVMPLKVKNIITPRRTLVVIVTIYVLVTASVSPVFYAIRLGWVFNEERNRSLIDLVYIPGGAPLVSASGIVNAVSQLTTFILVIVCSLFLVHGLREKTKWRQKSSTAGDNNTSSRDNKIVKMVLIVDTIFVVCYLPSALNLTLMSAIEDYSIVGPYKNEFQTAWSFVLVLEATNSAVNILVYYKMSTKFRKEFRRLFRLRPEEDI